MFMQARIQVVVSGAPLCVYYLQCCALKLCDIHDIHNMHYIMFMQARIQVVVSRAPSVTVMSSHSAPLTSQQTTGCNLRGTAKSVSMKIRVKTVQDCPFIGGLHKRYKLMCSVFSK